MKYRGDPSSGSQAGTTASHNRFGQYKRSRATPVNPNSTRQALVRAAFAAASAAWKALTDNQRAGWRDLGLSMTRTDSLGQSYNLQGNQAFVSVNACLSAVGDAQVTDAPLLVAPASILTATITATSAALSVAYTGTPLAAGVKLMVYCSPQRSAGRNYESDFRLVTVTAAAAASPANIFAAYSAKFGVPITGNRIFFMLVAMKAGVESGPFYTSAVVA